MFVKFQLESCYYNNTLNPSKPSPPLSPNPNMLVVSSVSTNTAPSLPQLTKHEHNQHQPQHQHQMQHLSSKKHPRNLKPNKLKNPNSTFHKTHSPSPTPKNPNHGNRNSTDQKPRKVNDNGRVVKNRGVGGDKGSVSKVNGTCSTKWTSYGGCIPSILQALDTIDDLDDVFRPWEDTLSNKERSIILKEQREWERALEIFEWFRKKGCYEVNVIHYNIMLRTLGKARKWEEIEALWTEMRDKGVSPINSTYGTLIDVYTKGGRREEALLWLDKMKEQGMEPDEVTMGIIMQMYKKTGEFQKAGEFFKLWTSGVSLIGAGKEHNKVKKEVKGNSLLSSYPYNTLIDTYGKAGQLEEASETFSRMLREGIFPTTVTFNTMIHICGNHGKLEEVTSLVQKMEELRCAPDTRTYNILISLHVKHDNMRTAANYFRKMKEARLEPDVVSYRTLLYAFSIRHMVSDAEDLVCQMDEKGFEIDEYTQSALTRMYIEAGMLEKSWKWFKRFHLTGNMTCECYSANIDAYGERGHIMKAEKVFSCCTEMKKLSVLQFNVMIKAYGLALDYDKACRLFDSMENFGVVPDKCSYSSLIQILASGDLPEKAKECLNKMQEAGLVSDCVPYCAVISSFVKLGKLDKAGGLYREMIAYNIKADVIVYGVLINACADRGSVEEATGYYDSMKREGLQGNKVIYNSLIKLYTKVGYLKEAQEIYRLLQSREPGSDTYSSNCMIDLYSEQSMVRQAEEIFERLKKQGNANEFTFAMMVCMYKRLGRFENAVLIAKQMRERGLLTDLLSYNNVLGLYALDGRFREAVVTFKAMLEVPIQPDECTFRSLGLVLVKCGISKQAVSKLEANTKKDLQGSLQAWLMALSAVIEVDDAEDNS